MISVNLTKYWGNPEFSVGNFCFLVNTPVILLRALILFSAFCLFGCGVESVDSDSRSSSDGPVQYFATLYFSDQKPAGTFEVFIPSLNISGITDEEGILSLRGGSVAGEVEIVLFRDAWGTASVFLTGLTGEEDEIEFEITVQRNSPSATIRIIRNDSEPSGEEPGKGESDDQDSDEESKSSDENGNSSNSNSNSQKEQIARGRKVFQSTCGQCHAVGRADGYNESRVKKTLRLPQHSGVSLSSSRLRDLVAFLNR